MSESIQHIVKGKFEGHFKTKQGAFLKRDEPFPKGDEHRVQIYRGIVSQSESLTEEEFEHYDGFYNFTGLNNVQVNTSNHWPIENDRIFSMNHMKLMNVEFSNVQTVGEHTLGEIKGDVVGKLKEGSFDGPDLSSDGQTNDPPPNNNENNQDNGEKTDPNFDQNQNDSNQNQAEPPISNNRKGCFNWTWDAKWLRWLLLVLAILFLLYLLGRCTQIGRKLYCKIDDWRIESEREKLKLQRDSLRWKIKETDLNIENCGGGGKADGKNELYEQVFDLGTNDGLVSIKFNANLIPDRMEVIYDGEIVAESNTRIFMPYEEDDFNELIDLGFTQYSDSLNFQYKHKKGKPTELLVRIIPNKDYESTEWDFNVSCPQ